MIVKRHWLIRTASAASLALLATGCSNERPEPLPPIGSAPQTQDEADGLLNGPSARATILPGEQAAPIVP